MRPEPIKDISVDFPTGIKKTKEIWMAKFVKIQDWKPGNYDSTLLRKVNLGDYHYHE